MKLQGCLSNLEKLGKAYFLFWAGTVGKTYTFDKNVGRKSWKYISGVYIFYIQSS